MNPLNASINRILTRWPDVVANPPETDREKLVGDFRRRWRAGAWTDFTISDVLRAARALFEGEWRTWDDFTGLVRFCCDEVRTQGSRAFLSGMMSIYASSYSPGGAHSRLLGAALRTRAANLDARWSNVLRNFPSLLDGATAHREIAQSMLTMAQPFEDLRALGLRAPHAPGLMHHVHLAFVDAIAPSLGHRPAIDHLLGWLKPESARTAIADGVVEAIEALLRPWAQSGKPGDDAQHVMAALVDSYGDPRTARSGPWPQIASDLRQTVERWLTGENIRRFLEIIDEVEKTHMFAPRYEFWGGLYERDRIDAAWVAFAPVAEQIARQQKGMHFGKQIARGARLSTSLLVLKIGRKIVIEGSSNYRVYVFDAANPAAPKLYQDRYNADAILDLSGSWSTMHTGNWQRRVYEQI
jgi:hypothetical protein